ncbi:alpha/beta hydrolase [Thermobifida halotolerans]|uniref:Alpha/beta hydrolase n=1 Tax=Thermobifida halotolerans TaxID=483545 RepID=A0AA97LVJ5_9ACTN|nr:alpha/beta hydrolase [Thermobifida halotolerans]UOE18765.1 alpha/beta hydrolase [Thermobifida halotolerans]
MGEQQKHRGADAHGQHFRRSGPSTVTGSRGWDGHEFTSAAGTRVHAAILGPVGAPEVVCVHGLGVSHRYFLPFAQALAPRHRVVAVDLPGFGRTPGPRRALDIPGLSRALADWLHATGRWGAPLVANSVGCQIAVDLAVTASEPTGPLVLNGLTVEAGNRGVLQKVAQLLLTAWSEHPRLVPIVIGDYLRCGPRRLWQTLRHALDDPVTHKLPGVSAPAVVVRGTRDRVSEYRWATLAAELLPRGHLVEVPGEGHALNYSAPRVLARITEDLLTGGR